MITLESDEELQIENNNEGLTLTLTFWDSQIREEVIVSRDVTYKELQDNKNYLLIENLIEDMTKEIQEELDEKYEIIKHQGL